MATRLYFHNATFSGSGTYPSGTYPSVTKNFSFTNSATLKQMNTTKGSSQASQTGTTVASTSAQNGYVGMWVSPPLVAQTIDLAALSASALRVGCAESNTNSNFSPLAICAYIWRPSTGARISVFFGGVSSILDAGCASGKPSAASTEQQALSNALASGINPVVQDGDVIVIELWTKITQSMATSYTATFYYDGTVDPTATNTATSSAASYIEFPGSIQFKDMAASLKTGRGRDGVTTADIFNGISRSSALTGAINSSQLVVSFWAAPQSNANSQYVIYGNNQLRIYFTNGKLWVIIYDSSSTNSLWLNTTANVADGALHHYAISVDTNYAAGAKKYQIAVDSNLQTLTVTDSNPAFTIDLTNANYYPFYVGNTNNQLSGLTGDLGELYVEQGVYLDFSVAANVQKFRTIGGYPANLTANDESNSYNAKLPLGTSRDANYDTNALIYLTIGEGNLVSQWSVNYGAGGTFTQFGTLYRSSGLPKAGAQLLASLDQTTLYFHHEAPTGAASYPASDQSYATATNTSLAAGQLRSMDLTPGDYVGTSQVFYMEVQTSAALGIQQNYFGSFVSKKIGSAVTIGTLPITIDISAYESNAAANLEHLAAVIYVWRPSTSSVVDYILDYPIDGVAFKEPFAAALTPQILTITADQFPYANKVAALPGDVIVVELWNRVNQASATACFLDFYFEGDPNIYAGMPGSITFSDAISFSDGPSANPTSSSTLIGSLATQITLASSNSAAASITATLSSLPAQLVASLGDAATVTAPLTTQIKLGASLAASASNTAGLTTQIKAAANLAGQASITATLSSVAAALAATLGDAATITAPLTTQIKLATALAGSTSLTPIITTKIQLASSMTAGASIAAVLGPNSISAFLKAKATLADFLPSNLSGLVGWYDAADEGTIYLDSSGNVQVWYDKSPSQIDVSQVTVANRPAYSATGFSGALPGIVFDGSTDRLESSVSPFDTIPAHSFFAVYKLSTTSGGYNTVYGLGPFGDDLDFWEVGGVIGTYGSWPHGASSTLQVKANKPTLATHLFDGLPGSYQASFRVNGNPDPDSVWSTNGVGAISAPKTFIGGDDSNEMFHGAIAEIVFFNRLLSAAEINQVENYLIRKWAIPADLRATLTADAEIAANIQGPAAQFATNITGQPALTSALSTQITTASLMTDAAAIAAGLTTQIKLGAAPADVAIIVAGLSTQIKLGATLTDAAIISAGFTTSIKLAAATTGSASASGALTTAIQMNATLAGASAITAGLTVGARLAASLLASTALTPAVTAQIKLAAAPAASATLTATITPNIYPVSIISGAAVGAPIVTPGAATVSPATISSGNQVGAPTATTVSTISGPTIPAGSAVGSPTATGGAITIGPASISGTTIGQPTVSPQPVTVSPPSIDPTSAFGSVKVNLNIAANSITSTAQVGSPAVSEGANTIFASGIDSTVTFGPFTLATSAKTIQAVSIDPTASFGTAGVTITQKVTLDSINPTSQIGALSVAPGAVTLRMSEIIPGTVVPQATLSVGPVTVQMDSLGPTATVGGFSLLPQQFVTLEAGIDSTVLVGDPVIVKGAATIKVNSIESTVSFSPATLTSGPVLIDLPGIASTAVVTAGFYVIRHFLAPAERTLKVLADLRYVTADPEIRTIKIAPDPENRMINIAPEERTLGA